MTLVVGKSYRIQTPDVLGNHDMLPLTDVIARPPFGDSLKESNAGQSFAEWWDPSPGLMGYLDSWQDEIGGAGGFMLYEPVNYRRPEWTRNLRAARLQPQDVLHGYFYAGPYVSTGSRSPYGADNLGLAVVSASYRLLSVRYFPTGLIGFDPSWGQSATQDNTDATDFGLNNVPIWMLTCTDLDGTPFTPPTSWSSRGYQNNQTYINRYGGRLWKVTQPGRVDSGIPYREITGYTLTAGGIGDYQNLYLARYTATTQAPTQPTVTGFVDTDAAGRQDGTLEVLSVEVDTPRTPFLRIAGTTVTDSGFTETSSDLIVSGVLRGVDLTDESTADSLWRMDGYDRWEVTDAIAKGSEAAPPRDDGRPETNIWHVTMQRPL